MKKAILIFVLLMMTISASAGISFTDSGGNEIHLKDTPENVCVLFSSYADMWKLAGGDIYATVYESVERGIAASDCILVDSGAGKNVDLERIILSETDFVIGSTDILAHAEAKEILDKTGIPTALFKVESIYDYLDVMETLTQITGNREAFCENAEEVLNRSFAIVEKTKNIHGISPNVLFIRSGSGYSSAKAKTSEQHFAAAMLKELGARNIADEIPVILDGLSFEEILMEDPDAVFISLMGNEEKSRAYMESVLESENWQMLKAVQNGRVYFLEKELFQFKPNEKWDEAYGKLAGMLYPGINQR